MVLHHDGFKVAVKRDCKPWLFDGFIIAVKAYNLSRVAAKIGGIALLWRDMFSEETCLLIQPCRQQGKFRRIWGASKFSSFQWEFYLRRNHLGIQISSGLLTVIKLLISLLNLWLITKFNTNVQRYYPTICGKKITALKKIDCTGHFIMFEFFNYLEIMFSRKEKEC
jgi:hypothetical protein